MPTPPTPAKQTDPDLDQARGGCEHKYIYMQMGMADGRVIDGDVCKDCGDAREATELCKVEAERDELLGRLAGLVA